MNFPKKIHYCWFGRNPLPDVVLKCIESWRKYCPDYEIVEWNENNFDVNSCQYAKEAYNAKKWAFVSDYCRFWVLYHFGGIYLDTDVEIIKPLDDLPDNFVGFERADFVASGLIRGAEKGDEICAMLVDSYRKDRFYMPDGSMNMSTVCERETRILEQLGLKRDGTMQVIRGTTIFPQDYFCPQDFYTGNLKLTENTYSIHRYQASWHDEQGKAQYRLTRKLCKVLPKKTAAKVSAFITTWKYKGFNVALKKVFKRTPRKD